MPSDTISIYIYTDWSLYGSLLGDLECENGVTSRGLGIHVSTADSPRESSLLQTGQSLQWEEKG